MSERLPIPVIEIVSALEREAANTDTDPRWQAAMCLRHMDGWQKRTLMCYVDTRPSEVSAAHETSARRCKLADCIDPIGNGCTRRDCPENR